jgi:hypothetical protein
MRAAAAAAPRAARRGEARLIVLQAGGNNLFS